MQANSCKPEMRRVSLPNYVRRIERRRLGHIAFLSFSLASPILCSDQHTVLKTAISNLQYNIFTVSVQAKLIATSLSRLTCQRTKNLIINFCNFNIFIIRDSYVDKLTSIFFISVIRTTISCDCFYFPSIRNITN